MAGTQLPNDGDQSQRLFQLGVELSNKGNFDYASEMFAACVAKFPVNPVYIESFLENLCRKYQNNKEGAKYARLLNSASKASTQKALSKQKWKRAIRHGLEVLKSNPWDISTLLDMATACEQMGAIGCELVYLGMAIDADPNHSIVRERMKQSLERLRNEA